MTQRIDTLVCPRWSLAVEPVVEIQEGLCLAVDKGRIVTLLPRQEAEQRFDPDARHERPDHLLMPGLINAHTHAAMTLMRGFADDMSLERWLNERIWPTEARLASPEFVADGTRLAIAEMLLGGTTCFADMYFFPDVVAETAVQAGIRVAVGMIALEFPTAWAGHADEYISKGLAVHDRYKGHPLVSTTFAPHAPYSVKDETLKRIRQLADELEVPVHIHLHETREEVEQAVAETGQRPLDRLETLGLVTPALMAVHATQLEDADIERLALAGAHVVHCPRSNLKLASGACPVAKLLDAEVNVALGTDGAASNNRLDLWSELQTAALFGKYVADDASAVPAAAAIQMATINGARALNLAHETGSLAAGKMADALCVRLAEPGLAPVLDPLSHLVYSVSREQVTDVWVAGEHLVVGAELARMDAERIMNRAGEWAQQVTAL